jgi:DNA-binding NarL/FixJ family response regulator
MDRPAVAAVPAEVNVIISMRRELQRFGVERMLQSLGGAVTAQVRQDLAAAIEAVTGDESTVLIVASPDIDAPASAALRHAAERGAKILVLYDDRDLAKPRDLARIGSTGYLCVQELNAQVLQDALLRIRSGEIPIPPQLARNLLAMASNTADDQTRVSQRMTPRERQVLALLAEGLSNKRIADRLGISEHGAKRLVANILVKLDCPTRTLAVAKALREGLCDAVRPRY